jgi:hypothetical protein
MQAEEGALMPKDRKFVNPLTQRTPNTPDTPIKPTPPPATDTSTNTSTNTPTSPSTSTNTPLYQGNVHRKHGAHAFEKTHERITLWIDKELKQRFEALAHEQGIAKTSLLNEAIADLLQKYEGHGQAAE